MHLSKKLGVNCQSKGSQLINLYCDEIFRKLVRNSTIQHSLQSIIQLDHYEQTIQSIQQIQQQTNSNKRLLTQMHSLSNHSESSKHPFIELFDCLCLPINDLRQASDPMILQKFMALISETNMLPLSTTNSQSRLNNLKTIIQQLSRINDEQIGDEKLIDATAIDLSAICVHKEINSIEKLLKYCFIVAAKSKSSHYFIEKILTLSENSQCYFAQLLRPHYTDQQNRRQNSLIPSPLKQPNKTSQPQTNDTDYDSKTNRSLDPLHSDRCEIQCIDKIIHYEQANEQLAKSLEKMSKQYNQLMEENSQLKGKLERSQAENVRLWDNIRELESLLEASSHQYENKCVISSIQSSPELFSAHSSSYRAKEELERETNGSLKSNISHPQHSQSQFHQKEVEELQKQIRLLKTRHQKQLTRMSDEIQTQSILNRKYRQKNLTLIEQIAALKDQCQQYRQQIFKITTERRCLQKQIEKHAQNQQSLLFQMNYKNSQVQELKQLLDCSSIYYNDYDGADDEKSGPVKILETQLPLHHNTCYSSTKRTTKIELSELRKLRGIEKQYKNLKQEVRAIKNRNKEAEYEKRRLATILKQYENSRGEENEIVTGCLYELMRANQYGFKQNGSANNSVTHQ